MKTIPLTQGQVMLIDDEHYDWLNQWRWFAHWDAHSQTYYAGRQFPKADGGQFEVRAHRMILSAPTGIQVDHRDGNGCNNQLYKIRLDPERKNNQNRRKPRHSSSDFKGVNWHKTKQKYQARIGIKNREFHLGYFINPIEAAHEYDWAAKLLHGEFAKLNFPTH